MPRALASAAFVVIAAHAAAATPQQASAQAQPRHGAGKLVIWGDLALFERAGHPDNCILTNRFKRGQPVGFRMTATDGGTGEVENTAVLVAHVTIGATTVDVPLRWRGSDPSYPPGYLRTPVELWTARWVVPDDAVTGALAYTVTATDAFGRTAKFIPFSYSRSQLTVVD